MANEMSDMPSYAPNLVADVKIGRPTPERSEHEQVFAGFADALKEFPDSAKIRIWHNPDSDRVPVGFAVEPGNGALAMRMLEFSGAGKEILDRETVQPTGLRAAAQKAGERVMAPTESPTPEARSTQYYCPSTSLLNEVGTAIGYGRKDRGFDTVFTVGDVRARAAQLPKTPDAHKTPEVEVSLPEAKITETQQNAPSQHVER